MSNEVNKGAGGSAHVEAKQPAKDLAPEIGVSVAGSKGTDCKKDDKPSEGCNPDCVYAFVAPVAGSRAFIGKQELENGTIMDGWITFNPTGQASANALMPGVIFYSHGVYVTDSKIIRDKLLQPLRERRAMLYRQYDPEHDTEITAYLKAPGSKCEIAATCE